MREQRVRRPLRRRPVLVLLAGTAAWLSVGCRASVPCGLPEGTQLGDHCLMSPDTVAGGGLGARMISTLQFFAIAVETGCIYLHQPLPDMGHETDAAEAESFLGFAQGCTTMDDARQLVQIQELTPPPGLHSVLPECIEEPRTLCRLGMARQVQLSFRARAITRRVLQEKFWAQPHPEKALAWYQQDVAAAAEAQAVPLHIALHLRRGDVVDLFEKGQSLHRYTGDEQIIDTLAALSKALSSDSMRSQFDAPVAIFVHLLSQGDESDFPVREFQKALRKIGAKLVMHVGETSVFDSFSHLVAADVLLYGVSSFPELAARWYSTGVARLYASRRVRKDKPGGLDLEAEVFDECFVDEVRDVLVRKVTDQKHRATEELPVSCGGAKVVPKSTRTAKFLKRIAKGYDFKPNFVEDEEGAEVGPTLEEKQAARKEKLQEAASAAITGSQDGGALAEISALPAPLVRQNAFANAQEQSGSGGAEAVSSATGSGTASAGDGAESAPVHSKTVVRDRFRAALTEVRARKAALGKYYDNDKKMLSRALLEDDTDPTANTILVAKMAVKMLRGVARDLIGQGSGPNKFQVSFKVAAIGGRIMSGFPGTARTSFMSLFDAKLADLWAMLNVKLEVRNTATDGHDADPHTQLLCLESLVGEDVDVVLAEMFGPEKFKPFENKHLYRYLDPSPAVRSRSDPGKKKQKKRGSAAASEGDDENEEEAPRAPADPARAAILESYLRAIYSVKSQPSAMLLYMDPMAGDAHPAIEAANLLDGELWQYHNMSRSIYAPFGRALDHLRWRSAKEYKKDPSATPPGCEDGCLAAQDCDLRECPLHPQMGDFFHTSPTWDAPDSASADQKHMIPRQLLAQQNQLFVNTTTGFQPFLLAHELVANQLVFHQLLIMERALNIILDYLKENEDSGFLSGIVHALRGRIERKSLPKRSFCDTKFCTTHPHCYLAQRPIFGERRQITDMIASAGETPWTVDVPQAEQSCNADTRARACAAPGSDVDAQGWTSCDRETYKCAFPGERLAMRGATDAGPLEMRIEVYKLKACRVLIYEPELSEPFGDAFAAVTPLDLADEDHWVFHHNTRADFVANWFHEVEIRVNGKRVKEPAVHRVGTRFVMALDLEEHVGKDVCAIASKSDYVTISFEVTPIRDLQKVDMCKGEGRLLRNLFSKKKCIPEGTWLGYDLPKACTMNTKLRKCTIRDGYERDPSEIAGFISHVVAV